MQVASNDESGDLIIFRSKTTDKLEVDNETGAESVLLTVIRFLYSCFIVLSFVLFTSPRSQIVNGVSLDSTMNITVLGNRSIFYPGTETLRAQRDEKKSGFQEKTRTLDNTSHQTGRVASVLAVPALFGKPMNTRRIVAPLLVLDIDACTPFSATFPNQKEWVKNIGQLDDQLNRQSLQKSAGESGFLENVQSFLGSDQAGTNKNSSKRTQTKKRPAFQFFSSVPRFQRQNRVNYLPSSSLVEPKSDAIVAPLPEPNNSTQWYALISRGNCPFDVKIRNAEVAGFSGIIIYNRVARGVVDVPVRMSANKLGAQVSQIRAMFLTQSDGNALVRSAMEAGARMSKKQLKRLFDEPLIAGRSHGGVVGSPLAVSMAADEWPLDGWGSNGAGGIRMRKRVFSMMAVAGNVILFVGVFMACGGLCTAVCLFAMMIRNYFLYGRFFVLIFAPSFSLPFWASQRLGSSDAEEGELLHDEESDDEPDELMEELVLPLRVIDACDLEDDSDDTANVSLQDLAHLSTRKKSTAAGGTRKCCAICIDEFDVGAKVRELPCHHQFHSHCIDPWLLRHNRLCPICKQDVLVVRGDLGAVKQPAPPTPSTRTEPRHTAEGRWWVISRPWSARSVDEHLN
ncbi:hypothetical protein HDU77_010972 [Chytriomyces hyalinus]|nr:hypothetical protein HDU77_010972 [Chytriomyces hyalinus]